MKRVLFVNHRQPACGVGQLGSRYYRNLVETTKYACLYIDIDGIDEFKHWTHELSPDAVIYNYYSGATMPWLSPALISAQRSNFKQVGIFHELPLESMGFDLILHQDPTSTDAFPHWSLPRTIPRYDGVVYPYSKVPRFGSFGFGLGGKGFAELVTMVCQEYDEALIHLHIPFAHFGDADGVAAHAHADNARKEVSKPGVMLTIDHGFWQEDELLDWLAGNNCNAFLYHPHYGRGISSVTDYALAVKRPLAITHSFQFQHITRIDDSFCVDGDHPKTLHQIIDMGAHLTDPFRELWSREAFVASFEAALASIGV